MSPVCVDGNAALQYWLAFTELNYGGHGLPERVQSATGDSKVYGFPVPISQKQRNFLKRKSSRRIDYRFRKATSLVSCNWGRDTSIDGFAVDTEVINARSHDLARVVLLYARREYEDRQWEKGNDYVLRTMRMARHIAGQIRPGENQCYMIENMARGTACAYLPGMPADKRANLADRVRQLPLLLPMRDAFYREAKLSKWLSDSLATVAKDPKHRREDVTNLLRVICSSSEADLLQKQHPIYQLQVLAKELGILQREVGDLMKNPLAESDSRFRDTILPRINKNPLARLYFGDGDDNWLRREDAQSECRAAMFLAAVDILKEGDPAAAKHVDPFGTGPFRIEKRKMGFRLVSDLRYTNNVDLVIGNAATNRVQR